MSAIRIVTDSASDLDQARADEAGIVVVPLTIRFGANEFVDRVELTIDEVYERMANEEDLPETAAPAQPRKDALAGTDGRVAAAVRIAVSGLIPQAS